MTQLPSPNFYSTRALFNQYKTLDLMIVYNITMKVDPAIEKDWVLWQQTEHMPDIMSSGQFTDYKFYRLLDQDEEDGITYIVQYFAESRKHYDEYINKYSTPIREKALKRWGNKFVAFRTIMQSVD